MFSLTALLEFISKAGSLGAKVYDWWIARQKPLLEPTLQPFEDPTMLRAFSLELKNVSGTRICLDNIFIRIPEGAEFAINWSVPLVIIGGSQSPSYPWELSRKYTINQTLDPGEVYDCEIGIPSGFAITASRKPPVTISVTVTTMGTSERKVVQDIKRRIAV